MARTLTLTILLAAAAGCGPTTPPPAKPTDPPPPPPEPTKSESPAEPKSKYSLAQYAKLKIGMTEDDVRNLLGDPTNKKDAKRWHYAEPTAADFHVIYLDFDDASKLATKGTTGFVAIDAAKLTKANVEKIRTGMTEAEVVELLGPGNPSANAANTMLAYTVGEKRIVVVFADGKVSAEPSPQGFD